MDIMNWHSAAENAGFATPGYRNSQYFQELGGSSFLTVINPLFSPDNDGRDDVITVILHPDEAGYIVNVYLFDSEGNLIRNLIRNRLVSSEDQIIWDGTDDNRKKAPIGIYIMYAEFFKPDGKKQNVKKAIVLGGKF